MADLNNVQIEEKVAELLSRMTLEEKFAQMRMLPNLSTIFPDGIFDEEKLIPYFNRCGSIYVTDSSSPELINELQHYMLHHTRLGIPVAVHGESLHGSMHASATIFPQAIGLGSTWNVDLMNKVARCIGNEVRSLGITQTYAPNLDLSRDARWGRVEENYGEDPYLTSEMGVAYIKGLQSCGVASSPKHYVAHGSPEGGINLAPVHAGERELRETLMVPFMKAFKEAKAMSVMPAYSELDGVPVHASKFLMTELLRDEFGFDGHAVSDFGAIPMLHEFHNVAENSVEAGRMALEAGIDVEAPSIFGFSDELMEEVRKGNVSEKLVDTAVSRILRNKFRLGLFEDPYSPENNSSMRHTEQAKELSLEAAHQSIVLLKNENEILPLSKSIKKLALVGPNAANAQLGDYTVMASYLHAVTIKQAFEERLGDRVIYSQGCSIAGGSDEDIEKAVAAAKEADAVVAVMGDNSCFYGGIGWGDKDADGKNAVTCGEGFDLSSLDLPGRQQELLERLYDTGKPIILVMVSGRPYSIVWAAEKLPAIVQAWYPGELGGYAVFDILFGDVNPNGKLPISFPRSAGHIPCFYNYKISARGYYHKPGTPDDPGRDYVFSNPSALYEFGYGLSYTTFEYSDLKITPEKTEKNGEITVEVTVKNNGKTDGYEVVQLYLRDVYSRITPFSRRLRGFDKIFLKAGETKNVSFTLGFEDFSFINENMMPEVESGSFEVYISNLKGHFEIK